MKFSLANIGKSVMTNGQDVLLISAGAVGAKKFFDFDNLFKNAKEDSFIRKHQGAVKLVAGVAAAGMVKQHWLKMLFYGIALEGGIKEARVLTTKDGKSFFEPLGFIQPSSEFPGSVAGRDNYDKTEKQLDMDSTVTTVGMDEDMSGDDDEMM